MTHTPGPWYAEGSDIGSAENITVGVAIAGRTDDGYISHAQVQANANLMASAPELLSALVAIQHLINELEDDVVGWRTLDATYVDEILARAFDTACTAIRLAEGRDK